MDSISNINSNSSFVANYMDFVAIHNQYLFMDMLFLCLFIVSAVYLCIHFKNAMFILTHRIESLSYKNKSTFKQKSFLLAKVIVVISITLLLFDNIQVFNRVFSASYNPYQLMLYTVASLIAYFVYKVLVVQIMGFVSQKKELYKNIRFSSNCEYIILATLLPPTILIPYSIKYLYVIPLLVLIAYFILHTIKIIRILIDGEFSFLELFLYLCGAEILPLLIIVSGIEFVNT